MQAEMTRFEQWERAVRISAGRAEMIVVADVGPRIMSLRVDGGENVLFVDRDGIGRGEWRIYGGHRIWLGPEAEASYAPDNAPCEVAIRENEVAIAAPVDGLSLLQKVLVVSVEGETFRVRNIIRNTGTTLAPCVVWCLTCIRADAKVCFPWGRPGQWVMKKICYWQKWCGGDHKSDIKSRQWQPGEDLFVIDPTGEEGKVGTSGWEGWMCATFPRANTTLVKRFAYQEGAAYVDEGCALQCYTCAKFIELESLSPQSVLHPGEAVCHEEQFRIVPGAVDVYDAGAVRAIVGG